MAIVCLGTTPTLARTMRFAQLTIDGVNRANSVHEYAAGKAVNAARAATTLGEQVYCISPRGGATGDRFAALLGEAIGPRQSQLIAVAAPTRMTITVLDQSASTSTELIEESGTLTTTEGERMIAALADALRGAADGQVPRAAVLSGSLAPGLATDFYARCVALCRAAGVASVVDASGEALRLAIDAGPGVVKINAGELSGLTGSILSEPELIGAAEAIAARSGASVIVTRGAGETLAARPGTRSIRASVPRVEVVSPIGSGDSFSGAFAVGLARGMAFEAILALATGSASANAMTADAAHFDRATAESLAKGVTLRSAR